MLTDNNSKATATTTRATGSISRSVAAGARGNLQDPFMTVPRQLGLSSHVPFGRSVQLEFNRSLVQWGRLVKLEKQEPATQTAATSSYEHAWQERERERERLARAQEQGREKQARAGLALKQTRARLAESAEQQWKSWSERQVRELERLERADWWRYSLRSGSAPTLFHDNNGDDCGLNVDDDDDKSGGGTLLQRVWKRTSRERSFACRELLKYCRSSNHLWDEQEDDDDDEGDDEGDQNDANEEDEDEDLNNDDELNDSSRPMNISPSAASLLREPIQLPHPIPPSSSTVPTSHPPPPSTMMILPQPGTSTYLTRNALAQHMQRVGKELVLLKRRIFSRHERLAIRQNTAARLQQQKMAAYRKKREAKRRGLEEADGDVGQDVGPLVLDTLDQDFVDQKTLDRMIQPQTLHHHHDQQQSQLEPDLNVPRPKRTNPQERYIQALVTSISHRLNATASDPPSSSETTTNNIICGCGSVPCAVNCPISKDQKSKPFGSAGKSHALHKPGQEWRG